MITIAEAIVKRLKERYAGGESQVELSRIFNVPQAYISSLISGQQKADNMRLISVQRMFPNATICLNDGNKEEYPLPRFQPPSTSSSKTTAEESSALSYFDKAMLEEWQKLDQQDKCRVMGFIAQLEAEKKSDTAVTA